MRHYELGQDVTFNRTGHPRLLCKLESSGIFGLAFGLIFSFLGNKSFGVVLNESIYKSSLLILLFSMCSFWVLKYSQFLRFNFILSVSWLLICVNNYIWLLNLNQTPVTL